MAKAGPEVKKLDMLLGDWTGQERGNSPDGAEYEVKWSGQVKRMGDFFYVHRGTWKDADDNRGEFTRIAGYDSIKKAYFIEFFNSSGQRGIAAATLSEGTFKEDWTIFDPSAGKLRERCTEEFSETEFTYECERHTNEKWVSSVKGKATKDK